MKKLLVTFSILLLVTSGAQTAFAAVPDKPMNLEAIDVSPTQVNLSWDAPQNDGGSPIIGYKIEFKTIPGAYSTLAIIGSSTIYAHTGLTTGTTYIYRVSSINEEGTSSPSSEAIATPTSTSNSFFIYVDSIVPSTGGHIITLKGFGAAISQLVTVTIFSPGGSELTQLTIVSTKTGAFSTIWVAPSSTPSGIYTIEATDGFSSGQTSVTILGTSGNDSDGDGVPNDEDVCEGFNDNIDPDGDGIPTGCDENPTLKCGQNTLQIGFECVGTSAQGFMCGDGTIADLIEGKCFPNLNEICGQGTIIEQGMCIVSNMGNMIGGTLLDIDTTALLIASIDTNPVITGLVAITLAGVAGQIVWFVHRRRKSENS